MTEPSIHEQAAAQQQKIDARLWQDPFAAAAKALDKSGKGELEQRCINEPSDDSACNSPLTKKDKETLVIGVSVSGAPYFEDAEHRRRTRYAVLAGLERHGFAPSDARHIGYFLWPDETPHQIVPYERFEKVQQRRVPYQGQNLPRQSILVLWLKEEVLKGVPLQKLSGLIRFLRGQGDKIQDGQNIKILGPYSSDMLRDMVKEAGESIDVFSLDEKCRQKWEQDNWPDLKNVQFYSYGASAPDGQLLGNLTETCGTVQRYFENLGIHLQRTIATDDTLARGIVSELKRRKIKLGPGDGDLALISEWDTFYGQTLPHAVERQFALGHPRPGWHRQNRGDLDERWITKLTYLRGLDGKLPLAEGTEDRKQDKATPQ